MRSRPRSRGEVKVDGDGRCDLLVVQEETGRQREATGKQKGQTPFPRTPFASDMGTVHRVRLDMLPSGPVQTAHAWPGTSAIVHRTEWYGTEAARVQRVSTAAGGSQILLGSL